MRVRRLHSWHISPVEAIRLQKALAPDLTLNGKVNAPRKVGGCDVAYDPASKLLYGGVVVWDLERWEVHSSKLATLPESFPYIPGLLGFREAPVLLEALEGLTIVPDVILVDGQGVAHPRGLGLAAHLGLHLDVPTVGCAKRLLIGEHRPPGSRRGDYAWMTVAGKRIGAVVRTRRDVRPLYVSPGNNIDLEGAIAVVLACLGRFRSPEPVRQAHLFVDRWKRGVTL